MDHSRREEKKENKTHKKQSRPSISEKILQRYPLFWRCFHVEKSFSLCQFLLFTMPNKVGSLKCAKTVTFSCFSWTIFASYEHVLIFSLLLNLFRSQQSTLPWEVSRWSCTLIPCQSPHTTSLIWRKRAFTSNLSPSSLIVFCHNVFSSVFLSWM